MDKEKEFEMIDCSSLAETLALNDWEEQTGKIAKEELYESPDTKLVKDFWANVFFALHEKYLRLIYSFKKPKTEEKLKRCINCKSVLTINELSVHKDCCSLCSMLKP